MDGWINEDIQWIPVTKLENRILYSFRGLQKLEIRKKMNPYTDI